MSSRKHSTEQIIRKLREAEVELAKGRSVQDVVFQYSVERSCRFSIVMIEEPAESFASGDRA